MASKIKEERDRLARFFDTVGKEKNIPDEWLHLIRLAYIFGQLCMECDIIDGRKLFNGKDNDED